MEQGPVLVISFQSQQILVARNTKGDVVEGDPVSSLITFIIPKCLACWIKISAEDILKYYSYFSKKIGFDISCKLSP